MRRILAANGRPDEATVAVRPIRCVFAEDERMSPYTSLFVGQPLKHYRDLTGTPWRSQDPKSSLSVREIPDALVVRRFSPDR